MDAGGSGDADVMVGAGDGRAELDGLEPALRTAFLERAGDAEPVWLAVGGPRSALVATRNLLFHVALVRGNVPPEITPVRLDDIRTVETLLGPSRTGVRVLLRSGVQYLTWVPRERAEHAMQAATVLNLLAADARARRPLYVD